MHSRRSPLPHQGDCLAERPGRVGIRRVVEADVAIADLDEGEVTRSRLGAAGRQRQARHAAADSPEQASAGRPKSMQVRAARRSISSFMAPSVIWPTQ